MLKISKLADYSMVLMQYMAGHSTEYLSATALAERTTVPLPTVSKLLKLLNDADLVNSIRGSSGGYQLARAAEQISILTIITAIDRLPAITECAMGENNCSLDQHCQLKGPWRYINQRVLDVLRPISLAQLIENNQVVG